LVFSEQCGSQTATIKEEKWLIDREDDEMERRATEWGRVRRQRRPTQPVPAADWARDSLFRDRCTGQDVKLRV